MHQLSEFHCAWAIRTISWCMSVKNKIKHQLTSSNAPLSPSLLTFLCKIPRDAPYGSWIEPLHELTLLFLNVNSTEELKRLVPKVKTEAIPRDVLDEIANQSLVAYSDMLIAPVEILMDFNWDIPNIVSQFNHIWIKHCHQKKYNLWKSANLKLNRLFTNMLNYVWLLLVITELIKVYANQLALIKELNIDRINNRYSDIIKKVSSYIQSLLLKQYHPISVVCYELIMDINTHKTEEDGIIIKRRSHWMYMILSFIHNHLFNILSISDANLLCVFLVILWKGSKFSVHIPMFCSPTFFLKCDNVLKYAKSPNRIKMMSIWLSITSLYLQHIMRPENKDKIATNAPMDMSLATPLAHFITKICDPIDIYPLCLGDALNSVRIVMKEVLVDKHTVPYVHHVLTLAGIKIEYFTVDDIIQLVRLSGELQALMITNRGKVHRVGNDYIRSEMDKLLDKVTKLSIMKPILKSSMIAKIQTNSTTLQVDTIKLSSISHLFKIRTIKSKNMSLKLENNAASNTTYNVSYAIELLGYAVLCPHKELSQTVVSLICTDLRYEISYFDSKQLLVCIKKLNILRKQLKIHSIKVQNTPWFAEITLLISKKSLMILNDIDMKS